MELLTNRCIFSHQRFLLGEERSYKHTV